MRRGQFRALLSSSRWFPSLLPEIGYADAEINAPSAKNPELSKVFFPLKAWSRSTLKIKPGVGPLQKISILKKKRRQGMNCRTFSQRK